MKEFSHDTKASFREIAARAAAAVDAEYLNSNMAQSEHSQLADPASGTILNAPFGVELKPRDTLSRPQTTNAVPTQKL